MANISGSTMATFLPEQWSSLASVTYRSNTVIVPLLDHRWEPEIGVGRGDTVNIPTFETNDSATNIVGAGRSSFGHSNAGLTFDATATGQKQLVINKMAYKGFSMPVEMALQSMPNYITLLTDGIGKALALYTDFEIASDATNGFDAFTPIGADNVDVTDDVLLQAIQVLDDANADYDERYFIVSPATYVSLLKIERYSNSLYGGSIGTLDGSKGTGHVGSVYNVDVYKSNNLDNVGISGKKNALFQKEAIAFAEQQSVKIVNDLNIEDGLLEQYVGYNVFGHVMVKSEFGSEVAGK
jgi:hypothetical protein